MKKFTHLYFLGIGGIGMSSLAAYFMIQGRIVGGYDRENSEITKALKSKGAELNFEEDISSIPEIFMHPEKTLIVYTPAIPENFPQLEFFRKQKFTIKKRAEILGLITNPRFGIAIAGSHGKTSVSAYVSWMLAQTDLPFSAFIGGIAKNFNSNLVIEKESRIIVAEADEFDRSFLQLYPNIAIITSMDADHLDIYGNWENLKDSFQEFANQVKVQGSIIIQKKLSPYFSADKEVKLFTYSAYEDADFKITRTAIRNSRYVIDVQMVDGSSWHDLEINLPGRLNLENALASIALAFVLRLPEEAVRACLASFEGVKRRFDYRIKTDKFIYLDDYAHHPKEIEATLNSMKELYPNRKICVVFQPHLFSRTRDFAKEFAQSLDLAHEIILLDIYPAREQAIQGVSSKLISNYLPESKTKILDNQSLLEYLASNEFELLITMGAGNIDKLVPKIETLFTKKYQTNTKNQLSDTE